jgi:hypothetical protein
MFNRKIHTILTGSVMAAGLMLSAQAAVAITADEAAELDASAKATLEQFKGVLTTT